MIKISSLLKVTAILATTLLTSAAFADADIFAGVHDEDSAKKTSISGTLFEQTLNSEYLALSKKRDTFFGTDGKDAELFNHKALFAARGAATQNDSIHDRDLNVDQRRPFFIAQERLYMVFDKGGRELAPTETATAQVAFDCWIEAVEASRTKDVSTCKARFEEAISAAEAKAGYEIGVIEVAAPEIPQIEPTPVAAPIPVPPQEYYIIPFEFDSTTLTSEGEKNLAQAIRDVKDIQELNISLRAHADRAGPENYNTKLSERRAETVLNRLSSAGIAERRLRVIEAVGESRSLIPTPDGVRNEGNRVVEIDLRQ